MSGFQVGLKSLLRQGLSEPEFYGDLECGLTKIVGSNSFSAQFIKIIPHCWGGGYGIGVLRRAVCLVVVPVVVGGFVSSLIARRWIGLWALWRFRLGDLSVDEMVGA